MSDHFNTETLVAIHPHGGGRFQDSGCTSTSQPRGSLLQSQDIRHFEGCAFRSDCWSASSLTEMSIPDSCSSTLAQGTPQTEFTNRDLTPAKEIRVILETCCRPGQKFLVYLHCIKERKQFCYVRICVHEVQGTSLDFKQCGIQINLRITKLRSLLLSIDVVKSS